MFQCTATNRGSPRHRLGLGRWWVLQSFIGDSKQTKGVWHGYCSAFFCYIHPEPSIEPQTLTLYRMRWQQRPWATTELPAPAAADALANLEASSSGFCCCGMITVLSWFGYLNPVLNPVFTCWQQRPQSSTVAAGHNDVLQDQPKLEATSHGLLAVACLLFSLVVDP